jgi:(4S)-4-hydroxy-5-phosphonooxypentane-2,3-dione isomerase
MIKRIVKLSFQQDKIEDFKLIFEQSKNLIRQRAGCLHVELLQDIAKSNVFFTLSYWEDEADLEAYRQSELFVSTWAKTKILFSDKPAAWSVAVVSIPDNLM